MHSNASRLCSPLHTGYRINDALFTNEASAPIPAHVEDGVVASLKLLAGRLAEAAVEARARRVVHRREEGPEKLFLPGSLQPPSAGGFAAFSLHDAMKSRTPGSLMCACDEMSMKSSMSFLHSRVAMLSEMDGASRKFAHMHRAARQSCSPARGRSGPASPSHSIVRFFAASHAESAELLAPVVPPLEEPELDDEPPLHATTKTKTTAPEGATHVREP